MSQLIDNKALLVPDERWTWPKLENASTQIRLLHLQPHTDNEDEIFAELEVFNLDSAPPFNAISYTWGTTPPTDTININGTPVLVRPSCRYALWQTRQHFPGRHVWLDAICINQDDLAEKSNQVALMGDIYSIAAMVLACVGPADASSDEIRDALADLDAALQPVPEGTFGDLDTEEKNYKDKTLWRPPLGDDFARQICKDFTIFCDREFFHRVWIIQELFGGIRENNCISILCGDYRLDWNRMITLHDRTSWIIGALDLWHDVQLNQPAMYHLETLFILHKSCAFELSSLLSHIKDHRCHDPRDRIFGTLKLLDWSRFSKTPPVPDYRTSPFHLAVKVLSSCDRPSLGDARDLLEILELNDLKLCSEGRTAGSNATTSTNFRQQHRKFWDVFRGAGMLELDTFGRLSIDLMGHPTAASEDLNTTNAVHGFLPVYTNDDVSVLVCLEARPGDIVAQSSYGNLVLRKSEAKLSYVIVGPAQIFENYLFRQRPRDLSCLCWHQDQMDNYREFFTYFAIQISDEDALIAACAHEPSLAGNSDRLNILRQHSLGTLTRGTLLEDITRSWVGEDKTFGPKQALCPRHKSVDHYRQSGEALMYNIALQAGAVIYVSKGLRITSKYDIEELLDDDDSSQG